MDALALESSAIAQRVNTEIEQAGKNPDINRIIGTVRGEIQPRLDWPGRDGGDDAMWTMNALKDVQSSL